MRYTFKVNERLKKEQHIHTLFQVGKAFSVFPLRVIFLTVPRLDATASPVMTGFSVPKKKFRSSVHRHRVRRLVVEAWRHNKHMLYADVPEHMQVHMFFVFTDNKLPELEPINKAVFACIDKLKKSIDFKEGADG